MSELEKRAAKLRKAIDTYRTLQHEKDESPISPEALDSLKRELAELETAHPELVTSNSPTQKVAGNVLPQLKKVPHVMTQWSLNDAFTEEDVRAFDERVRKNLSSVAQKSKSLETDQPRYAAELKIDGLHIVLTYKDGKLITAATRGNGKIGEDVTHAIRTIKSVPQTLSKPIDVIVEGEVFMTRSGLKKLNASRAKDNLPLFANPRNAAAGSIRQLDASVAALRCFSTIWMYLEIPINKTATQKKLMSLNFQKRKVTSLHSLHRLACRQIRILYITHQLMTC
jgi:DNA ligase (NAD+)